MKKNEFYKGLVFLMLAQSMVGINIVISKFLLYATPVLVILAIRFVLATFILLPLHWATPAKQVSIKVHFSKLKGKDWMFLVGQGICAGVLFNCLMLAGLNYTDANVAGIITSALPAIIAVMSWLVLGEKISAQKGFCVAFATAGLLVIGYGKLQGAGVSHSFFGDSIVLLSLLPEAVYYILCKLYSNRLPLFLTTALLNGVNALFLLPAIFLMHWEPSQINAASWFILFVIGLGSGLFYVFWFLGAQRVDGVMASLSTAIMPVATVIIAWVILGEQLTRIEFVGMVLVISSIVLYARR